MGELAQAIRQVNERELDANELAIAACFPSPAHELSDKMKALLAPFIHFCEQQRVRALPARPTTVARICSGRKTGAYSHSRRFVQSRRCIFWPGWRIP
jgi:hypothetical protein